MFEVNEKAIVSAMVQKQLTIRDLARKAGLTETTTAKLLKSGATANGKTAGKLAAALGLPTEQILKG